MSARTPVALQFEFEALSPEPIPEVSSEYVPQERPCDSVGVANSTNSRIPGAMRELFGEAANVIESTFRQIEIADELIRKASRRHPHRAEPLRRSFLAMRWLLKSFSVTDELYTAHVTELVERVVSGEKLAPGTRAEALAALSHTSLKGPFTQQPSALFEELFCQIYPRRTQGEPRYFAEPWAGASKEILTDLRRQLAAPERDEIVSKARGQ